MVFKNVHEENVILAEKDRESLVARLITLLTPINIYGLFVNGTIDEKPKK